MTILRLFNGEEPGQRDQVSALWSVRQFVDWWYVPALLSDRTRRRPSSKTINKRKVAAAWWSQLMGTARHPDGPALCEITADDLDLFRDRLKAATYLRGKRGTPRTLSEFSQHRQLEELLTILNAAGPKAGRRVRAGVLDQVPAIYLEAPACWPKDCWTVSEAKNLTAGLASFQSVERRLAISDDKYRQLARASIAFWFYTGHRASTVYNLSSADLVEVRAGQWFLHIARSVKTGKSDRVAVHPTLLESLRPFWKSSVPTAKLIPWPFRYRALHSHHERWQEHANQIGLLEAGRLFSPQAWRRLHATAIAETGYQTARTMAAGALGHSSAAITETFYASVKDAAVLSLPALW